MYAGVGACPCELPLSPSFLSFIPTFLCIYCRSYYTNGVRRDGKGLVMVLSISFCLRFLLFCLMEQRLGMVHLPGKARNAYLSILSDNFVLLTHPEFLQVPYVY